MRKKSSLILIAVVLFATAAGLAAPPPLAADSQVDIGLHIPYYAGIEVENEEDAGEALEYLFLLPDLKYNYFFTEQGLKAGIGFRMFTLILESIAYPIITLETDLGPFTLSSHIGGGTFLLFGLFNSFEAGHIYIPEITAAYHLTETFSLGTGAMFLFAPQEADLSNFAYIGHVFARFTF